MSPDPQDKASGNEEPEPVSQDRTPAEENAEVRRRQPEQQDR